MAAQWFVSPPHSMKLVGSVVNPLNGLSEFVCPKTCKIVYWCGHWCLTTETTQLARNTVGRNSYFDQLVLSSRQLLPSNVPLYLFALESHKLSIFSVLIRIYLPYLLSKEYQDCISKGEDKSFKVVSRGFLCHTQADLSDFLAAVQHVALTVLQHRVASR